MEDNKQEPNKIKLNKLAVIGFILGILSALSLYEFFAIIPILAILVSSIGLYRIKIKGHKGKGIAIAGLVLGILFVAQFGIKIFLKNNDYFKGRFFDNIVKTQINEDGVVKEELNYCMGGEILECNTGYSCIGGQVMSCMGGINMACAGGNWNLGTTCMHGYTISHTYTNRCQHGQTISHTYTNPCIHGFTYAHNEPCIHGFTYTHNYIEKCIHGYEKEHTY